MFFVQVVQGLYGGQYRNVEHDMAFRSIQVELLFTAPAAHRAREPAIDAIISATA